DVRVIERGRADLAKREVDLVADRDEACECNAARLAARQERTDHAAGVRSREDAADRKLAFVEGRVRRQHRLRAQVDHAEARWSDDAQARAGANIAQTRDARGALVAGLREAVRE